MTQQEGLVDRFGGFSVWRLLSHRANLNGHDPFLIWHPFASEGRTWTYSQMHRDAASVAVGLRDRGVSEGDRVLIHLDNCPEFLIAWFACAALGAVAVTTNSRSAGDELEYYADHCSPKGAISQPRLAELVSRSAPELKWQVTISHDAGEEPGVAGQRDADSKFEALMGDPNALSPTGVGPLAPMSIQYTSGTTSRPKGVLWTHANALWGAQVNASHETLRRDDCHFVYMPLYHTNALAYSMLATLWVGARFVLVPKWSTSRFWEMSVQHGCTWLSLLPLSRKAITESSDIPANSYRLFGGGVCDWDAGPRLPVKTIGWWGMTETITHGIVGDAHLPNRPLSMGRPAPEYEIKVVRHDGLTPVEAEEAGDLLVRGIRGVSLFAGYYEQPTETDLAFDEHGWFRTGDRVTPHADGHITFADRAKDMLKVGGENVAASEIERVIATISGVTEVAVVGRPDPKLDEVAVAFVRADRTHTGMELTVVDRCRTALADFKVPREVFVVSDLPRSNLRKVNKSELRRVAAGQCDLEDAQSRWASDAAKDPFGDD